VGFDDYKVILYRNQPEGWVAEIPAIPGVDLSNSASLLDIMERRG